MIREENNIIERFHSLKASNGPPWMLWRSPSGEVLLAAGALATHEPASASGWRDWMKTLKPGAADGMLFFLLAFDPAAPADNVWSGMPRAWAFEPRTLIRLKAADTYCSKGAGADSSTNGNSVQRDDAYVAAVHDGLRLLRNGGMDKIVLARSLSKRVDTELDVLAARMLVLPDCFCILFSPDGERVLLSVTPERLARVVDGAAHTAALAGTALRGSDTAADAAAGSGLKQSIKEDEEHEYVVKMIAEALAEVSDDVRIGARRVFALRHVYHLMTDITAKLHSGVTHGEIVSLLHPTPAVAGLPREAAMTAIADIEGFDRGLFAGAVGWMDAQGNGDAAVTIRSALLHDGMATVYAGAGIVRDSDPEAEHEETAAKMRLVLEMLSQG